jgi:predicted TPR repeat methyltransferase
MEGRFAELLPLRRRQHEIELQSLALPNEQRAAAVAFLLARDGLIEAPLQPPPAYVAQIFDRAAESFDQHLTHNLHYRGPELVVSAVTAALAGQSASGGPAGPGDHREPGEWTVLDAGCGTGLAGALLRPLADRLEGVDLSSQMLELARCRQIYDHLECADLQEFLATHLAGYDLIVAIDVLIYLGDLQEVFRRVAAALCPGGIFACSVEQGDPDEFRLRPTGRYVHGHRYLAQVWETAGLQTISVSRQSLRNEDGCPVPGLVCVVRRPVAG